MSIALLCIHIHMHTYVHAYTVITLYVLLSMCNYVWHLFDALENGYQGSGGTTGGIGSGRRVPAADWSGRDPRPQDVGGGE